MSDRDEHLEVLRAMWGELKTLNARINTTNSGLADLREYLGARIDATNERLDGVIVELKEGAATSRLDRGRLARLERRVDALERRER